MSARGQTFVRAWRWARAWRGIVLVVGLSACTSPAAQRLQLERARLERAEQQRAAERAPALWQRFEQTRGEAEAAAPGTPERADYETEARLWLEAAIAEAERAALSEARLEMERETAQLEAQVLEEERARSELALEAEREAARELARTQAALALARSEKATKNRVRLSRTEVEAAALALITRAELVHQALAAWGVDGAQRAALEARITRARNALANAPDEALREGDQALFAGLSLLGSLRGGAGEPSEAERAALAEALEQAGAKVQRNERGLGALVPGALRGSGLGPSAPRVLSRVCALTRGHPHGPVQAVVPGANQAQAQARERAVREQLGKAGCAEGRVQVERRVSGEDALEITWLAY